MKTHNFADVSGSGNTTPKAVHMTNAELEKAQAEGRLFVDTFQGMKQVAAIQFNGDGKFSTARVWTEDNDAPLNDRHEWKAERRSLRVQSKFTDQLG